MLDCVCGFCDNSQCQCDCHGVVVQSGTVVGGRRLGVAPVTAEGLRERIAKALAPWCRVHEITEAPCERCALRLDAVLAALAGDPGDLPARMREAVLKFFGHDGVGRTETTVKWAEQIAAAAMSVRWEGHAATVARLADAVARAEHAEGQVQVLRERETKLRQERDEARRIVAAQPKPKAIEELQEAIAEVLEDSDETAVDAFLCFASTEVVRIAGGEMVARWQAEDALKAAEAEVERLRAELADALHRGSTFRDDWVAVTERAETAEARVAALQRDLADAKRDYDMTADYVGKQLGFNQALPAATSIGCAMALGEELAEAKRAVRTAQITHIREWHPNYAHVGACAGCQVLVPLSAAMPSRPDDPEEIRRLAQATTEEKTDEA